MRRPRKAYAITFRPAAEADLFALYDYIAAQSGLARAGEYIARIERACLAFATFPERGTRRDDILPGLRTIGFMFSLGKPCIGLQTDIRRALPTGNNPMICGSMSVIFQSVSELIGWLESACQSSIEVECAKLQANIGVSAISRPSRE